MDSPFILWYIFTSVVAGYVSVSFFKSIGGVAWIWNTILTASLFAVPLLFNTAVLPRSSNFTLIELIIVWLVGE